MATKKVVAETAQAHLLAGRGEAHAEAITAELKGLAGQLNVLVPADLGSFIAFFFALLRAAAAQATGADVALTGSRQLSDAPVDARDQSGALLHALLARSRELTMVQFGARQAAEAFGGRVPLATSAQLSSYAKTVSAQLLRPELTWIPLPDVTGTLDLAAMAARIAAADSAHDAAVGRSHAYKGAVAADLHTRNLHRDRMHDVHHGARLILEGLLRTCSFHDLADALVMQHHVGHDPVVPPTPAPRS
jgi:hypothetical protein